MAVLPLFHITGLVHQMHLPVLLNAEVVMLPQFTMEKMLDVISEYKLNELLLVPPILIRLFRDPLVDKYDLSHVTRFSSGAAPLSEEIIQHLQKKFPKTGFKQSYGMTESCSCITSHPQRDSKESFWEDLAEDLEGQGEEREVWTCGQRRSETKVMTH